MAMSEIDQLRERNKELERLAYTGLEMRNFFTGIYSSQRCCARDNFDALYAKLFPPKPPEAKFKVGQFVKLSGHLAAYKISHSVYIDDESVWKYQFHSNLAVMRESELSALSEEEAGR